MRTPRDAARRGVRVRLLLDDLNTAGQDLLLLGLAAHANVELRLFNPFPAGRDRAFTRLATSLFDLRRLNRRRHNKLFIADGVMAVVGGRNIADEYFMQHPLANFIDLDVFASGVIVTDFSRLFDQYWNSRFAYPVESSASPGDSRFALQARFEAMTRPAKVTPIDKLPASDVLGRGPLVDELGHGKLGLVWSEAKHSRIRPRRPSMMRRRQVRNRRARRACASTSSSTSVRHVRRSCWSPRTSCPAGSAWP